MDLTPYRHFAAELATRSGDFILPHYGNPALVVETKADLSPVTVADRGAEALLRDLIARRFPGHGIIGEEYGRENADAEFVWVLDPIDGTKSFVSGVPLWGTLIALLHRGEPVLGCIHQPVLRQLLIGDGRTTTLNDRAVRCRAARPWAECTFLTTSYENLARHPGGPAALQLAATAQLSRTWGDCYGYLLVSQGWADVMLDPLMNPWDIAALVPVVRGAGGVITDFAGRTPTGADSILAGTPSAHATVLAALGG